MLSARLFPTSVGPEKSICLVHPKLGLKGYMNKVLFSLQSNKEWKSKVKI